MKLVISDFIICVRLWQHFKIDLTAKSEYVLMQSWIHLDYTFIALSKFLFDLSVLHCVEIYGCEIGVVSDYLNVRVRRNSLA